MAVAPRRSQRVVCSPILTNICHVCMHGADPRQHRSVLCLCWKFVELPPEHIAPAHGNQSFHQLHNFNWQHRTEKFRDNKIRNVDIHDVSSEKKALPSKDGTRTHMTYLLSYGPAEHTTMFPACMKFIGVVVVSSGQSVSQP